EERYARHIAWHGVEIGKPDWSWESRSLAMHLYDRGRGEVEDIYFSSPTHTGRSILSSCLTYPSIAGVVSSTPCRCPRTTSPNPALKKCCLISGATWSAHVPLWCSLVRCTSRAEIHQSI